MPNIPFNLFKIAIGSPLVNNKSLSMYFEIDCKNMRARAVRIFGYSGLMGDGIELELSEKSDNLWMYAKAGSPNGVLLDVICTKE